MRRQAIPTTDADLDAFQAQFIKTVSANPDQYGLTTEDVAALQAAQGVWAPAFALHKQNAAAARTASTSKGDARGTIEKRLQSAIRKVNAVPGITNAMRVALGLPEHAPTHLPTTAPTTWPIARIVDLGARRQQISWSDSATPGARAKPHGVHLCEVWLKIGDPRPVDETTCVLIERATKSPYVHTFALGDVGKPAYWLLRWESTKADAGPFGPVAIVTVPA